MNFKKNEIWIRKEKNWPKSNFDCFFILENICLTNKPSTDAAWFDQSGNKGLEGYLRKEYSLNYVTDIFV